MAAFTPFSPKSNSGFLKCLPLGVASNQTSIWPMRQKGETYKKSKDEFFCKVYLMNTEEKWEDKNMKSFARQRQIKEMENKCKILRFEKELLYKSKREFVSNVSSERWRGLKFSAVVILSVTLSLADCLWKVLEFLLLWCFEEVSKLNYIQSTSVRQLGQYNKETTLFPLVQNGVGILLIPPLVKEGTGSQCTASITGDCSSIGSNYSKSGR